MIAVDIRDQPQEEEPPHLTGLTLALNLVLPDVPRALLLFSTLRHHLPCPPVRRLLLIVPDKQLTALSTLISHGVVADYYPTTIIPESHLLGPSAPGVQWEPYAIQMALKLLVSQVVDTQWYLTLDADVLAAGPLPGFDEPNKHHVHTTVYVDEG